MENNVILKAKKVKAIFTDVDGVLTDGTLYYLGEEEHGKGFFVRDGLAIKIAEKLSIPVYFISAKKSSVLRQRAKELGVSGCYDGSLKKVEIAENICNELKLSFDEVCYIGDDIVDIPLLNEVGFSATVKDCAEELKDICDFISSKKGGKGAFREIVELIIKSKNRWEEVLAFFK